MAKIQIEVTDDNSVKYTAKISGIPASAGLDSLTQFMATQNVTTGGVTTPMYTDPADFFKKNAVDVLKRIVPQFPSSQTKADVDDINAKIASLQAKRDALFAAALEEK